MFMSIVCLVQRLLAPNTVNVFLINLLIKYVTCKSKMNFSICLSQITEENICDSSKTFQAKP